MLRVLYAAFPGFFEIYPDGRIPVYPVGQNFQMLLPFMYRYKCPTIEKELYGVAVRRGSHSRQILTREETEENTGRMSGWWMR